MLSKPPPAPGPAALGLHADHLEYQKQTWPISEFGPILAAAASKRDHARAAPVVDGFAVCRLRSCGSSLRLLRELSSNGGEGVVELMRVSFRDGVAILHHQCPDQDGWLGGDSGNDPLFSDGCCGQLEPSRLGRRFQLFDGLELLPDWQTRRAKQLKEAFPHTPRTLLGTVDWVLEVFSQGLGSGHWRMSLQAPGLPVLLGCRTAPSSAGSFSSSVELAPPGGENETPWLVLGPPSEDATTGQLLCWRHPISTVLALSVALAAMYPWGSTVQQHAGAAR